MTHAATVKVKVALQRRMERDNNKNNTLFKKYLQSASENSTYEGKNIYIETTVFKKNRTRTYKNKSAVFR